MPRLDIVIGCDADPDRHELVPVKQSDRLQWRGIREGIPRLKESTASLLDDAGKQPIITWCWRSDEQVEIMEGNAAHIPSTEKALLASLTAGGDEHAWHAHVWRQSKSTGQWFQDSFDLNWQKAMLIKAHQSLSDALGEPPVSLRTGWTFHNQTTFETVAELGIRVDFSALPGLRIDPPADRTKLGANYFDWSTTPYTPYRPDAADYRKATFRREICSIAEVPCTVVPSLLWGMLGGGVLSMKMRDPRIFVQALRRPTYLVTIPTATKYFSPMLAHLKNLMSSGKDALYVTYFHADELIAEGHRLYSLSAFKENLAGIMNLARRSGFAVNFRQAREIPALWLSS